MSAQLDLAVNPAQIFKRALRPPAGQISGAIEAAAVKRIGQEALPGQVWALPVARRNPCSANVELARDPNRTGLHVRIEHIDLGVGNRASDTDRSARARHRGAGGPDGRFCGAIHVLKAGLGDGLHLFGQTVRQGLATNQKMFEP